VHYLDRDFVAITRQASTSARLRVGEAQQTALIESKTTVENGNLIERASSRRAASDILL
jgi:hypothetical protein